MAYIRFSQTPLSRLEGATATRAAICFLPKTPGSGSSANRVSDTCFPTSGTERSKSYFPIQTELCRIF